jgi:hypothetical protein
VTKQFSSVHGHVLVEGAGPGDLEFTVRWLLAAARADRMLKREFAIDPSFRVSIERLEVANFVEFRPAAMAFLRMFFENLTAFTFDLERSEWAEIFVIMVAAGFFQLTGNRYQMTVPKKLDIKEIKKALRLLAATEDENCELHPEEFVYTARYREVIEWRKRLVGLDWQQRVTDRAILLDSI